MKKEVYSPGQAEVLFDYWPKEAEWFVLGGPSDANEAQTIHARYPDVRHIAFEPNPAFIERQKELDYPGTLHEYALWNKEDTIVFRYSDECPRSATAVRKDVTPKWDTWNVKARTLDDLEKEFGPFPNMVLWLDIEHAEHNALQGAKEMFARGDVLLLDLEIQFPYLEPPIAEIMEEYGMEEVTRWKNDVVYRKKQNGHT